MTVMPKSSFSLRDHLVRIPDTTWAQKDRHLFNELNPDQDYQKIAASQGKKARRAAVMIPIFIRPGGASVLLTIRPQTMPTHPGEIAFPGGGITEADGSAIGAALRETEEEVGVAAHDIEVIGELGVHFGGRGFAVSPVIGLITGTPELIPCPREVDEMFEVPLDHLTATENHIVEPRTIGDLTFDMYAVPYATADRTYHIWGLTAGILHSLAHAYREAMAPDGP